MGNPEEPGFTGSAVLDLLISMLDGAKGTRARPAMTGSQKAKKNTKGGFQMHFSFVLLFFSSYVPDFFFPLPPSEAISSYFLDSAKTERKFIFHVIPPYICD